MFTIKDEPLVVTQAREKILNEFKDLIFYEEGHKYFLNGIPVQASVSGVGHRFIRDPFNEQLQATRYAQKNGMTAEYWIQQWKQNSFRATTLGTKTHAFGESLGYIKSGHPELINPIVSAQYDTRYGYLAPIHPKEEAVQKFFSELPVNYHLVLNETKVYSGKNPNPRKNLKELICGTFDMLYYCDNPEGFVILDYKTNAKLYNEYNRSHHKTLLPPFDNMIEEDVSLYTIQLSLYSLMLEDIGIPVIDRKLVWLRDGEYEIIPVPDVSGILRGIL